MAKDTTKSVPSSRRGFNPLQEGYTPTEKKGYTANVTGQAPLPKAPRGGTGETRKAPASTTPPAASSEAPQ